MDMHAPLITLDYAFDIHGIEQIDLLSIDTDGTETKVLFGFLAHRYQPRLIIVEYNHALKEIDQALADDGGYQRAYDNGLNAFYVRTADDARIIREAAK